MNYQEKLNYGQAMSTLADWNFTTVIRTHYKLKPHVGDRKVKYLIESKNVNAVFYSLEEDVDTCLSYNGGINHAHLLLSCNTHPTREFFSEALGVNIKAVLNVEKVKSQEEISKYVTKLLNTHGSHHNFFF